MRTPKTTKTVRDILEDQDRFIPVFTKEISGVTYQIDNTHSLFFSGDKLRKFYTASSRGSMGADIVYLVSIQITSKNSSGGYNAVYKFINAKHLSKPADRLKNLSMAKTYNITQTNDIVTQFDPVKDTRVNYIYPTLLDLLRHQVNEFDGYFNWTQNARDIRIKENRIEELNRLRLIHPEEFI